MHTAICTAIDSGSVVSLLLQATPPTINATLTFVTVVHAWHTSRWVLGGPAVWCGHSMRSLETPVALRAMEHTVHRLLRISCC
jgi:hypothetical protein